MKRSENSRRDFIRLGALTVAGAGLLHATDLKAFTQNTSIITAELPQPDGTFSLPPLPYDYAALEPYIDTMTMQIHHDKHHNAYVTKLNEAIEKAPELKGKSLDELVMHVGEAPEAVRMAIRNHGGGHWNHSFFWKIMSPDAKKSAASDAFKKAVMAKWSDMDAFKADFQKSASGLFGSGWTWLAKDKEGALSIINTPNQDNPMMDIATQRGKPVMGVDVWEHAYYLKHKNVRADYLNDIWNVIDWGMVSKLYEEM